ncbi:hypothetical protein CU097_010713 [Rhizopus azygosporus]|uniref:Uncharacterized protein n=1 Tax=Rhizopus azygosporus TaxID=86630 RepID=A0A367KEY6_RHIAZ|nr:hypothetical protein CU097_010713 [Rhizopus azygosporus]
MRGAGCIINDLWDRDIDDRQAIAFLSIQVTVGLAVLTQFDISNLSSDETYNILATSTVAGYMNAQGLSFYVINVLGTASHVAWQLKTSNTWAGAILWSGIVDDAIWSSIAV